ncbi:MAG: dihydrolipoamide acetyltransferase family protein [Deltaproteobacteria bacterium]|jgi:pyruvate dehydrogenase E2 component (dihydrolipoamide acetyltransferase)
MPVEFKMPDPGEGIHEAEVLEIHVSEGDRVEEGQTIMLVETDKASVEVPAPVTGQVKEIRVNVGDVVEVGEVLMVFLKEEEIEDEEKAVEKESKKPAPEEKEKAKAEEETEEEQREEGEEKKGKEKKVEPEKRKKSPKAEKPEPEDDAKRKGPVPATPATRRLARELDVALDQVKGSGPGGRVTAEDVQAHAEAPEKKPEKEKKAAPAKPVETERPGLPDFSQWGEVERTPLRSVRRTTARRMALSWSEIPRVTHEDVADITELEKLRQDNKGEIEKQGGALTLTVFAIKAAVAALKAHPRFNASLDIEAREIISKKYFHMGIAVDTDRGLLVPVVRDADCKSMVELAKEVFELAERTRQGEVEPRDMTGGTFTITNVGPLGGTGFTPIINYPQVAILGLARARLQPVVRGGIDDFKIVPRLMLPLCLGFDHRIVDGADAARFLGEIIRLLESPENLMLSQ